MRPVAVSLLSLSVLLIPQTSSADVFEFTSDGEVLRHITSRTERAIERGIERRALNPAHRKYIPDIAAAAIKNEVPPELVLAVMQQESNFDPEAFSGEAHGLMQLTPGTAERYGLGIGEIYDPIRNIEVGTEYLGWLVRYYDGNFLKAVAAYNAGEGAVDKYDGVPPYPETQNFVDRVTAFYGQPLTPRRSETAVDMDLTVVSSGESSTGVFVYDQPSNLNDTSVTYLVANEPEAGESTGEN